MLYNATYILSLQDSKMLFEKHKNQILTNNFVCTIHLRFIVLRTYGTLLKPDALFLPIFYPYGIAKIVL
jgi:hypothetical protein